MSLYKFVIDSSLVLYAVGWLIYFFYLVYILLTTLRKNWRLLVIVTAMIVNATACIVEFAAYSFTLEQTGFYAYAFADSADTFVHWMFCYTYIKLSIEVRFMFDRRIYMSDPMAMQEINRYNCFLNIANAINVAICGGMLAYGIITKSFRGVQLLFLI